MTEKLYPKQCEKIYSEAKDNFDAENYKDAISKLTQVLQMDEGYGDGAAKLFSHNRMRRAAIRIRLMHSTRSL